MNHRKALSRYFPAYHPKAGQPTYFVEKLWASTRKEDYFSLVNLNSLTIDNRDSQMKSSKYRIIEDFYSSLSEVYHDSKFHTIRQVNISKRTGLPMRVEVGDAITFYVWSGKPYHSPQIVVSPQIEVKKVWDFEISAAGALWINDRHKGNLRLRGVDSLGLSEVAKNDGVSASDLIAWFKYPKPTGLCQIICWSDEVNY